MFYRIVANIVDPDQTALKEQFDQVLHCLLRHFCPNIDGRNVNLFVSLPVIVSL